MMRTVMTSLRDAAAFIAKHVVAAGVVAVAFLVPGGLLAPVPTLHWLSRALIAAGAIAFSVTCLASAWRNPQFSGSRRLALAAMSALTLLAAIDELLPDPYRSSNALLVIAGLIGLSLLVFIFSGKRAT